MTMSAASAASALVQAFVVEAVERAAAAAEQEDAGGRIEACHLERVVTQLLLDTL